MLGSVVKLFLVDGSPSGVIRAELSLFTGLAVVAPRAGIEALSLRPEVRKHGVYILSGPDPQTNEPLVYVGETDNLIRRLVQHESSPEMDFFDRICVIASKDENLTKGHCLYLESRLIADIKSAARVRTLNVKAGPAKGLPEPDTAEMEGFLQQIGVILPLVGFDILRPQVGSPRPLSTEAAAAHYGGADIFQFEMGGASAQMQVRGGEYVILTGSTAVKTEKSSLSSYVRGRRAALQDSGGLVPEGELLKFTVDAGFKSPSAASSCIAARSDNGHTSWRLPTSGLTLRAWQEQRLKSSEQELEAEAGEPGLDGS